MPKEPPQKLGAPRQRPVSCQFCRTRKLRCSRDSPCSNCRSRNIQCELEQPVQVVVAASEDDRAELLERIRKLEAIVEQSTSSTTASTQSSSPGSSNGPGILSRHARGNIDNDNQQARNISKPSPIEQLDRDFAWLESLYDGTDSLSDVIPSTKVGFRVCSLHLVAEPEQFIAGSSSADPSIIFWLPEYSEAKILIDKFLKDVEPIHHVILTQSLPLTLERAYVSLTAQGPIKSGEMILLLSVLAAALHSWTLSDCRTRGLFTTCAEPHRRSALWVKAAEDLVDIAHRSTKISFEGLQGLIIMTFIAASYKGFSRRCWFLMNNALALARELGLHWIDHPSNKDSADTAEAEVGRRIWWYLVASDWAMATKYNGLARGTYTCHPRHMMTNKPLNVNDEDVFDGMRRVGRPLTEPTQMTYFVLRIRLNEISRNIVDRTPLMVAMPNGPSYDIVMDIDTELQLLLNDIPDFFTGMTPFEIAGKYGLGEQRALVVARQGHDFRTLFYATRCKLHLPFARRGFTEPEYATSRAICIESARLIIKIESEYQKKGYDLGFTRYQPLRYSMTVFLAATILLMDYCHKIQASATDQERSKLEICNALSMLEATRAESEIASRFLDSLVTVLKNHGIAPPKRFRERPEIPAAIDREGFASRPPFADAMESALPVAPLNCSPQPARSVVGGEVTCTGGYNGLDTGSDLNSLVRSLDQGVDMGMIEWDDIFLGLGDSSFL